jgi:lipoyl(octanoyl) transferase
VARLRRLGRASYPEALALQEQLLAARITEEIPDTVILVEHEAVYTVGRRKGAGANLLAVGDTPVVHVSRGGDVTWHGPGQVVAYPIVKLIDQDLHAHLRRLEALMIDTCAAFGLEAGRDERNTGTWIAGRKVGSVGVACRSWVTWHGLALNVSCDLEAFARINPCGFPSAIMTSMSQEKGAPVPFDAVLEAVAERFAAW